VVHGRYTPFRDLFVAARLPRLAWIEVVLAAPTVKLPYQFNGLSLSKVAADLATHAANGWPPEVVIDFGGLGFVRPAGIVFLSNMFAWMNAKGTRVSLTGTTAGHSAVRFLDDAL
jgi:hypothetical protein